MTLLLDTHALIWWLGDDDLDPEATRRMSQPDTRVFVSAVSVWEIAIKQAMDRIDIDGDVIAEISNNGFDHLAISAHHARAAGALPLHHRDPFDRMLVAQAQLEGLTLVTRDPHMAEYDVALLPC